VIINTACVYSWNQHLLPSNQTTSQWRHYSKNSSFVAPGCVCNGVLMHCHCNYSCILYCFGLSVEFRLFRLLILCLWSNIYHVVYVQGDCWRQRLKLIALISLSIHMMTSQDRMCVQCVTNGLQRDVTWLNTEKDTLEKTCIHVVNVRNVFHLVVVCLAIRIFTQVNTSAWNVADVVRVIKTNVTCQPSTFSTQTKSFRRETVWMYSLQQTIHTGWTSCYTQQNSQWREAIQMSHVWQGI